MTVEVPLNSVHPLFFLESVAILQPKLLGCIICHHISKTIWLFYACCRWSIGKSLLDFVGSIYALVQELMDTNFNFYTYAKTKNRTITLRTSWNRYEILLQLQEVLKFSHSE